MARKKTAPNSGMDQVQGSLVQAVDHVVTGIEQSLVDHAEDRIFNFVLGGELSKQLAARMMPHLEIFKSEVGAYANMPGTGLSTLALGSAIDVDAEVDDV